ncbi:MAG: DUF3291 domain-containing protein [Ilumatobacteraceae bacterium]
MPGRHIAQLNVGIMIAPTDDPAVAEFMDNLDRINALADDAEGFVWRLQTEQGNATDIQIFENPLQLVNMSVWETVESFKAYVYRSEHVDFFRRRVEWFEPDGKQVVLWSIDPGTIPSLGEAVRRLRFLERHGPSPYAFGIATPPAPLLFSPLDPAEHGVASLASRALVADRGEPDVAICASSDGVPVGVGVAYRRGPGDAEFAIEIAESATLQLIREAITDQLELATADIQGAA